MLVETMKKQMMQALKAGRTVEKEVLRVALGELQVNEARGVAMTDEAVVATVRKLIKANEETRAVASDEAQQRTLTEEIAVLQAFLPKTLSVDELVAALEPVSAAVRAAANDGQATGVAMKHLKAQGLEAQGKDVSAAVKQLRAG